MITMKTVFLTLLVSNFIAVSIIGFNFYSSKSSSRSIENRAANTRFATQNTASYQFEEKMTAYKILEQLDVFEPVDDRYYNNFPKVMNYYHKPYYGLKSDNDYCIKHRAYFVDHPEFIFQEKNVIMDYPPSSLVRKVVRDYGTDIMPKIGAHLPKAHREKFMYPLRPDVNIYFTNDAMHTYKHTDKQFSCITQVANHIPGRATINRKDYMAESVVSYAKRYEDKPNCFNFDKFFPKTWVLRDPEQCRDFFENNFKGEAYEKLKQERTIVYMRKIGAGSHQGKGVQPVDETEEAALRKTFGDGALCGKVKKSTIIQHYIYNPLLLNEHKFDFRIYLVVASTNPSMVYYHDGFLRVSLHEYDVSSKDKGVLLTNTALSHKIFDIAKKEGNYQGLNETELRNFQMWNFQRLHTYLLENNYTSDPNWVNNYLRPEFQKAMIHLVRMTKGPFLKRSNLYELFGCDFMLDNNLNIWFIECNSGPVLSGSSDEKEKFVTKMLRDQFDIVMGLLKSRAKRIIAYINTIIKSNEYEKLPSGEIQVKDLETKRKIFKQIIKNNFEPEFKPSADNGFVKITDENFYGTERFSGLIQEECLFEEDVKKPKKVNKEVYA